MMAIRILLIDDEVSVLNSLRRVLRGEDHEILVANGGPEALDILADREVAVIICDQQMPGMSGAEVLAESVKLRPDAVRITLTGHTDLKAAQASVNQGRISQFLLKPWDDDHLRAVVREAVHRYQMEQEIRHLHEVTRHQRDELEEWNRRLGEKVRERTEALSTAYEETLDALVLTLDVREHATAGHSRRVAIYCLYLALEVGIPRENLEDLYRGALLHDIGKIGIPDAALLKPGPLDTEERQIIEQHVVIGSRILERVGYLEPAIAIPRYHHERYDGTGYSEHLADAAIPIEARIFAIVDVYDALTSERAYKKAMPHSEAIGIITADIGKHFDPNVASTFLDMSPRKLEVLASAAEQCDRFPDILTVCEKVQAGDPLPTTLLVAHDGSLRDNASHNSPRKGMKDGGESLRGKPGNADFLLQATP